MATEWLVRFLLGGFVISLFASAGDILRPKSFAGVFAAAPSLALATLAVTISGHGWHYAATEARSMIVGAAAFVFYAWATSRLLRDGTRRASVVATLGLGLWLIAALAGWFLLTAVA
jgi:hypothetical protein